MEINDNIIQKILKLKELSERGATEGEINNATRVLQFNLDKYGITLDDIIKNEGERVTYSFSYSTAQEKVILTQCMGNLFGSDSDIFKESYRYKNGTMKFYLNLTKSEYAIFSDFYNFHREQFKRQLKDMEDKLLMAYLHNQDLFDKNKENNSSSKKESKYSFKDMMVILAMADSMKTNSYRKSIE
ncbi:hypothetical protein DAC20_256 [Bacteroides phage DAC20]|nr:hypothetical protein DAC19_257 [Bacteroides phage DAC19]QIG64005.1 hypothetical protein DAC20_256 [Bacteroides phage DAC20]QIG64269.1 hypothetical protein DAC22_259 [Bacteroides phage DAC22]QIG64526.1 hypothetical protein DAC23_252 [Bacteroides phage DAC23]